MLSPKTQHKLACLIITIIMIHPILDEDIAARNVKQHSQGLLTGNRLTVTGSVTQRPLARYATLLPIYFYKIAQ